MATKVKHKSISKANRPIKPRRKGYTRLSSKNQITLPIDAVRKAGLKPGDELEVKFDQDGHLLIERELTLEEKVDKYAGFLTGVYPPGFLKELRKDWD